MKLAKVIYSVIFLLFSISLSTQACTCFGDNSLQEEYSNSSFVIRARILDKEEVLLDDKDVPFERYLIKYTVEVLEKYKGNNRIKYIYTGQGKGDCGYSFELNKEYLIYGKKVREVFNSHPKGTKKCSFFYTDICTKTKFVDYDEISRIKEFID